MSGTRFTRDFGLPVQTEATEALLLAPEAGEGQPRGPPLRASASRPRGAREHAVNATAQPPGLSALQPWTELTLILYVFSEKAIITKEVHGL